jgi:hypothetical protein
MVNRVWLVTSGEAHEGYQVVGVHSSAAAAEAQASKLRARAQLSIDEIEIELWEIDGAQIDPENMGL